MASPQDVKTSAKNKSPSLDLTCPDQIYLNKIAFSFALISDKMFHIFT